MIIHIFRMLTTFICKRNRRCVLLFGLSLITLALIFIFAMMLLSQEKDVEVVENLENLEIDVKGDNFTFLKTAFTVSRTEAQRFGNFTYLKDHPDKCAGEDVLLLLFVKSAPKNAGQREAIRSTWGNQTYIQHSKGVTFKLLFALGAPSGSESQQVIQELDREDRLHGDLIQQDFEDTYRNLTLKWIMQFRWVRQRCANAHFFMTADDDVFVHTLNLADYLQDALQRNVTELWVGNVAKGHDATPDRRRDSKWYVPIKTYPWSKYPAYTLGGGYLVSQDVVEKVYRCTLTLNATLHDDVTMGICANIMGVTPQDHAFFAGYRKAPSHPCIYKQMMTSHSHRGQDMYRLWNAAMDPQVLQIASKTNCTSVKKALLCNPNYTNFSDGTYSCEAAFI